MQTKPGTPVATATKAQQKAKSRRAERRKRLLLAWAGLQVAAALVAFPAAPFLYRNHFLVLVLLRPTPTVLLAGGYLAQQGHIPVLAVPAAAVPLQIAAVWLYYALGRAWSKEITSDDQLPFVTARLLQREQVRTLRKVVRSRGPAFAAMARFSSVPPGAVASTAGAAGLEPRSYLLADGIAAIIATSVAVAAGYTLGVGGEQGGPWVVAIGVIGLAAFTVILTTFLRRERKARKTSSRLR